MYRYILILFLFIGCTRSASQDLLGLWESEETSMGGIGHTLEFRPDGSYVEATTVIVDMPYSYHQGILSIGDTQKEAADDAPPGSTVTFQGDELIQQLPDGTILRRKRLTPVQQGEKPIVGAWRYRHYTGAIAFEQYTPDQVMHLRLPMRSSSSTYMLDGNMLTLIHDGGEKSVVHYKVASGRLNIEANDNKSTWYRKSASGPWYPRDTIDYESPPEHEK